jgi:excisionase family DNA binding protein
MALDRDILNRRQLADYLGVTPQALSQMAHRGSGPKYLRIGRSVRYRRADVEAWLSAHTVERGPRQLGVVDPDGRDWWSPVPVTPAL